MNNIRRFSQNTLLTLSLVIFTSALYSQQNSIRVTPLQPAIGKFSLDYERSVAPRTTVMVEYQRWFERRTTGAALWMFGIPATSWDETYNSGYRMSAFIRQYKHAAMQGGFMEGGLYFGRHDITTQTEMAIFNPDPLFFFNLWQTSSEEVHYENVGVYGLRLGGGWHKVKGKFSLELSGGFNLNGNSQGVRPTLGMKAFSPYTRFALGVAF